MTELKTLKDFDEVWTNKWNEKHYDKFGEKVIDTKEITIMDDTPSRFVKFDEIKQEAIKWVKQHSNIKPNWAKETNEEFFKGFFNITEDDINTAEGGIK